MRGKKINTMKSIVLTFRHHRRRRRSSSRQSHVRGHATNICIVVWRVIRHTKKTAKYVWSKMKKKKKRWIFMLIFSLSFHFRTKTNHKKCNERKKRNETFMHS